MTLNPRKINYFEKFLSIFSTKDYDYNPKAHDADAYCGGKREQSSELFSHQKFVRKFILQEKIRGILLYHGLGSGKTCASISSAIMLSKNRNIKRVVVFLPAFLRNNFEDEILKCNPDGESLKTEYKIFSYNASNVIDSVMEEYNSEDMDDLIEKLEDTLFIVDEAHHIIQLMHNSILKNYNSGDLYSTKQMSMGIFFYNLFMSASKCKIIFLSGTPLTNFAYESAILGNVLCGYIGSKKYTLFPENIDKFYQTYVDEENECLNPNMLPDFERRFLGMISYVPTIDNREIFPEIKSHKIVRCVMKENQRDIYLEYIEEESREMMYRAKKSKTVKTDMNGSFMVYSRMASNFVFPAEYFSRYISDLSKVNTLFRDTSVSQSVFFSYKLLKKVIPHYQDKKAYKSLVQDFMNRFGKEYKVLKSYLKTCSIKQYEMLKRIRGDINDGSSVGKKTMIYSFFKNYAGSMSLEWSLKLLGFERYPVDVDIRSGSAEYDEDTIQGVMEDLNVSFDNRVDVKLEKKREGKMYYLIFEGDADYKRRVLELYNSSENRFGEIIPILIISSAGSEGINLKNVRYIHIMEPYWNMNRIEQVIGRARRLCSHYDLPPEHRDVSVYKYIACLDEQCEEQTTDTLIQNIADGKENILTSIYNVFKDSSADCVFTQRKSCTAYKYDMQGYNYAKGQDYWYDYYDKNMRRMLDVSGNLDIHNYEFYAMDDDVHYLALSKNTYDWHIFTFDGSKFKEIGVLHQKDDEPEIVYLMNNDMLLNTFKKNEIEAGHYNPINE